MGLSLIAGLITLLIISLTGFIQAANRLGVSITWGGPYLVDRSILGPKP